MSQDQGAAHEEQFEHDTRTERADESATPGEVGALDGAAAAGSAGAVGDANDDGGGFSTDAPDPSIGPD